MHPWNIGRPVKFYEARVASMFFFGLPWSWRQDVPQNCWYLSTKLHGVITKRARNVVSIVVRTSNLAPCQILAVRWVYVGLYVYFNRIHQNGFVSAPNQRNSQLTGRRDKSQHKRPVYTSCVKLIISLKTFLNLILYSDPRAYGVK